MNDTIMTKVFENGREERTYCEESRFDVHVYPGQAFGWIPYGGKVVLEAA